MLMAIVAAGLADRCEVQVAYAIGVAHPVSVMVETFGTEKVARGLIARLIEEKLATSWPEPVRRLAGAWSDPHRAEALRHPQGEDALREAL